MSYTADDQINRALRLIGILAEGEVPTAQMSQDALMALNQMLDSWSIDRLMIYSTQDQVFTWNSGQISRTLGPSGDFVGNRPILVDPATYYRDPSTNVSYGINLINQMQYDGIAVKTVHSTYPQMLFVNMSHPNIEMFIYPVPTRALEWHFISVEELSQPATLATNLSFPPGYQRAFAFNLALELCSEFGITPPDNVVAIAASSKEAIERINNPNDVMSMPYGLVAKTNRYNIYAGDF